MGPFFTQTVRNLPDPQGSLLGSIVQPLLDWGARKAEVERSRALYVERLAAFSQAYLQAIEDVENTLYQERKQREFLDRLERRRHFLERTVEETRDRYTNGLTDFLPVLDAIKELQRIERIIVRQERALLGFRIQLHRALGGRV
jgi:outer membrane protein TolC